jgi:hypothetical protein
MTTDQNAELERLLGRLFALSWALYWLRKAAEGDYRRGLGEQQMAPMNAVLRQLEEQQMAAVNAVLGAAAASGGHNLDDVMAAAPALTPSRARHITVRALDGADPQELHEEISNLLGAGRLGQPVQTDSASLARAAMAIGVPCWPPPVVPRWLRWPWESR